MAKVIEVKESGFFIVIYLFSNLILSGIRGAVMPYSFFKVAV